MSENSLKIETIEQLCEELAKLEVTALALKIQNLRDVRHAIINDSADEAYNLCVGLFPPKDNPSFYDTSSIFNIYSYLDTAFKADRDSVKRDWDDISKHLKSSLKSQISTLEKKRKSIYTGSYCLTEKSLFEPSIKILNGTTKAALIEEIKEAEDKFSDHLASRISPELREELDGYYKDMDSKLMIAKIRILDSYMDNRFFRDTLKVCAGGLLASILTMTFSDACANDESTSEPIHVSDINYNDLAYVDNSIEVI